MKKQIKRRIEIEDREIRIAREQRQTPEQIHEESWRKRRGR